MARLRVKGRKPGVELDGVKVGGREIFLGTTVEMNATEQAYVERYFITEDASVEPVSDVFDLVSVKRGTGELYGPDRTKLSVESTVVVLGDRKSRDLFLQPTGTGPAASAVGVPSAGGAATGIASGTDYTHPSIWASSPERINVFGAQAADDGSTFFLRSNNQTAGFLGNPWVVAFLVGGGTECEIIFKSRIDSFHRIRIDGVLVSEEWTAGVDWSNDLARQLITFPDDGVHRIDIEGDATFRFHGVRVPTGGSCVPVPTPEHRCMFFGDSFAEPSGAMAQDGMAYVAMRLLGFEDAWVTGYGGSGYTQVGGAGTQKSFITRAPGDADAYEPDVLIVQDQDSNSTLATFEADALTFWQARRAALPDAVLVAIGNINPGATSLNDYDEAVQSAVEAADGYFIPMHSVITGTGRWGAKANDGGNADLYWGGTDGADTGHPSPAGHRYIGEVIAERVARALAADNIFTAAA